MPITAAQGQTARLEVRFFSSAGVLTDPVAPLVDVITPSGTPLVTDATPVRDATGLYHYNYPVAVDAALGRWRAHWTAVFGGIVVAADDYFDVVPPGTIVVSDPTALLPDAVAVAVAWARANPMMAALLGAPGAVRVATNVPESPALPFLRATVIPGAPSEDEPPLRHALVQWDSYAAVGTTRERPDYPTAALVARTVEAAVRGVDGVLVVAQTGDAWLYGGLVATEPHQIDEPGLPWARYRIDTLLSMRAA